MSSTTGNLNEQVPAMFLSSPEKNRTLLRFSTAGVEENHRRKKKKMIKIFYLVTGEDYQKSQLKKQGKWKIL